MAKIRRLASKPYRDAYVASRVRTTVAMQIRALRRSLGYSQIKFARLIGTTQSAVSDLENPDGEQVAVQTLLNIAAALNVALVVRFAGFPAFLRLMSDMSPEGLAVETIDETIARSKVGLASAPIPTERLRLSVPTGGTETIRIGAPSPWSLTSQTNLLPSEQKLQSALGLPSIGTSTPTSAKDSLVRSTSQ